jgi:hypothetical protein
MSRQLRLGESVALLRSEYECIARPDTEWQKKECDVDGVFSLRRRGVRVRCWGRWEVHDVVNPAV